MTRAEAAATQRNAGRAPHGRERRVMGVPASWLATALVVCAGTLSAAAHDLGATAAERNASGFPWSFEPWVLVCLAVSAAGYGVGVARLWSRAGAGRGLSLGSALAFAGGWLALVLALVSPLDPLGSRLFSVHMVQHELLMVVAAPLLVLGRPLAAWAWALPIDWCRSIGHLFGRTAWTSAWGVITAPLAAWSLHALVLWVWHLPVCFSAALAYPWVHVLQHTSFLGTALIFWWSVLGEAGQRRPGSAMMSLFTTMAHTGALGALMTLSPLLWYPAYVAPTLALGLDPLEDQQVGGLVMWIPAGAVYVLAALALGARLLNAKRPRRSPRYEQAGAD
jgi:putative membrane protein